MPQLLDDLRARAHHDVVPLADLRACGLGPSATARWCAAGRLFRVHPRTYAWVPLAELTRQGQLLAGAMSVGGLVGARGRCALELLDVVPFTYAAPPALELVTNHRHRGLVGLEARQAPSLTASDLQVVDHVPGSAPARALLDTAADGASSYELTAQLRLLERERHLLPADHAVLLARAANRAGAGELERAVAARAATDTGPRSRSELQVLIASQDLGLERPRSGARIRTAGGSWECDVVWEREMVVAEIDGPTHLERSQQQDDRARDDALRADGWRVVRIPWSLVWDDLGAVVATLRRTLA